MTEFLDFLFGLLAPNHFHGDYSNAASKASVLESPEKERILEMFKTHMDSDPATACIVYDSILVKSVGKKHVQLVALKDGKKVFRYYSKNEFGICLKKRYIVMCR